MSVTFNRALRKGVSLLLEIPRDRAGVQSAMGRLARFRKEHPKVHAVLLRDQPPGSPKVDYDLLLDHPKGGTVGLTYSPDNGLPWSVDYADHWAADFVLSVDKGHVTIQDALLFLKLQAQNEPDLMKLLVDKELIAQEVAKTSPRVSPGEVQAMGDVFRVSRGLQSARATRLWLSETGVSEERFWELCAGVAHERKLRQRVTRHRIKPYFRDHHRSLDIILLLRVVAKSRSSAAKLLHAARKQGLLRALADWMDGRTASLLDTRLVRCRALDLDTELESASVGAVVGPTRAEGGHCVVQILGRQSAVLDATTRREIQQRLFSEWLSQRRQAATIQWHWM
jgi:putative peptide maturation system protein